MDDAQQDNARAYEGLEAMARLVEGPTPFAAADAEDNRAFRIAWGLLATAHRQGAAIVLLHRHGLGHDTSPNRRALLEHAARIWWLAEDGPDAVHAMNRSLQQTQGKLRKAADESGLRYDPTVADAVAAADLPPNSAETFGAFTHLMKRIGPPLLAIWISESMMAHPTLTGAQLFTEDTDEGLVLHANPVYPEGLVSPEERAPFIALVLVWFAMVSFNRLLAGKPWADELQRIAAEAGIEDLSAGAPPKPESA
ncbi:hypothetical protein AB0D30_21085 [Streptomyces sp. NPDC048409]|uniref:hypothetical protein n=1 Tax=Streptomyces sp. NPDC048409 TaxID=3154723 RepID=UPI0034370362